METALAPNTMAGRVSSVDYPSNT